MTALVAIVLGMGMPTAAVYIVLVTVVAPALIDMGIAPMAAHLFLFYFGLLSMLTPPVAVASMVAASMAGSDMWRTGLVGVKLAVVAYLMPFLWAFNPALILDGTPMAIVLAVSSATVAAWMLARALQGFAAGSLIGAVSVATLIVAALLIGSSTIWLGHESMWAAAATIAGAAALALMRYHKKSKAVEELRSVLH